MRIVKYKFENCQYLIDIFGSSELVAIHRKSLNFAGHDLEATVSQSVSSQL